MVRCSQHNLFLYKALSKSRIIKTFEIDRRKPQRRLRILILLQQMGRIKRPNQKKKKLWDRDIFKNRQRQDTFETFHDMSNDRELFFCYFRMSPQRFDQLLILVRVQKEKRHSFQKILPGRKSASNNFTLSGIW